MAPNTPGEPSCILDPGRDCLGLQKAKMLEEDIKEVRDDLNDLRKQNSSTHERIFERLGHIEAEERVQGEQYKHILEKIDANTKDLSEMKDGNKSILEKLTKFSHKFDDLEEVTRTVDEIKEKPAKRWDEIVKQVIGLVVGAIATLVLVKIGLM